MTRAPTGLGTTPWLVAVALLAAGGCGGGAATGAGGGEPPREVLFPADCNSNLVTEPDAVTVTCADDGVRAADLKWSGWGGETALARGTALVNDCKPDCASGEVRQYAAGVELSRIEKCEEGRQYTHLSLEFTKEPPAGFKRYLEEPFRCA